MSTQPLAAPFPWFGGKRRAAPLIWAALGDPGGYVEPFAGSAAALLARPAFTGRRVETINDLDGWLVNAWRAIKYDPDATAEHAAGPVTEIDYHARLAWLQARREGLVSWLEGDPETYDAKAAGWWLYVVACGIGDPFGSGPWSVVDGHLIKGERRGVNRKLPHLGCAGRGIVREANLSAYLRTLATRLARVRITCGDWRRVLSPAASGAKAGGDGSLAILLDPPYDTSPDLYKNTSNTNVGLSEAVGQWCRSADPDFRIALCGYDTEHDDLLAHGWTKRESKSGSGSGMSAQRDNGRRERLWLSPACLQTGQDSLFDGDDHSHYTNRSTNA